MGAFIAELKDDFASGIPLIIWITVSIAVAISGPFGSYENLSILQRFGFWTPVCGLGLLVGSFTRAFVYGSLGLHGFLTGSLLVTAIICICLCPPMYLLVNWLFSPMFGGIVNFTEIFLLIGSISLGVCSLRSANGPAAGAKLAPVSEPEALPVEPLRLLRRIEPQVRGDLWAITVRDHYVDVQTSTGKSSLLMRFSDAIDEACPLLGAQVHRSHWVAWQGVGSACREGGKLTLHLHNGHQIPVSRKYRAQVDARFPPQTQANAAAA